MRKQIAIAAGLAALSTSAWATKARLQALGQDTNYGSLYYSDSRSVFKNPAYVNEYNNYVVTEWGADVNDADNDSDVAPSAEGGFFKSAGSINYGFYFGNENDSMNNLRNDPGAGELNGFGNGGANGFLDKDNVVEVFVGGDAGIQWGASLQYASNKDELALSAQTNSNDTERTQKSIGLNLGVIMGNMEAYARLGIKDESKGAETTTAGMTFERDFNPTLGVAYSMRNNTFFAEYEKDGADYLANNASSTLVENVSDTYLRLGWGKTHKVSDSARVYTDAVFTVSKREYSDGAAANDAERTTTTIPVTIGMEADATSWLTLRGSVRGNLIGNRKGPTTLTGTTVQTSIDKKVTIANQVSVAAGATLNFGKLKIDGVIGTRDNTAPAVAAASNGILNLDDVMSRVAVHYWF